MTALLHRTKCVKTAAILHVLYHGSCCLLPVTSPPPNNAKGRQSRSVAELYLLACPLTQRSVLRLQVEATSRMYHCAKHRRIAVIVLVVHLNCPHPPTYLQVWAAPLRWRPMWWNTRTCRESGRGRNPGSTCVCACCSLLGTITGSGGETGPLSGYKHTEVVCSSLVPLQAL